MNQNQNLHEIQEVPSEEISPEKPKIQFDSNINNDNDNRDNSNPYIYNQNQIHNQYQNHFNQNQLTQNNLNNNNNNNNQYPNIQNPQNPQNISNNNSRIYSSKDLQNFNQNLININQVRNNINDNEEYEIVKISYIDENNQRKYLDKLVPKSASQNTSKLASRNDLNINTNNFERKISQSNSRNISRNISKNNSRNNLYNKNPRFSNTEIPSVIDEEYVNNRIRKTEIVNDPNNNEMELNENENNNIQMAQAQAGNISKRRWYSLKRPSLPTFKCPSINFGRFGNMFNLNSSGIKFFWII